MYFTDWISNNFIEIFGAVTGVLYVILEIKQNTWLWPVGIITSAVYIWVFLTGKLYADMSLQVYYLGVSFLGWYWWVRRVKGRVGEEERGRQEGSETEGQRDKETKRLKITQISLKTGIIISVVFCVIYIFMWLVLSKLTDSPVPAWDSFITSLSVVATWMLARKIYEHWYLWIVVNIAASILFFTRGLYPTVILYIVYCGMSFAGLKEWGKSLNKNYQ